MHDCEGVVIGLSYYERLINYLRDHGFPGPYKSEQQELWEIYHGIKNARYEHEGLVEIW